MPSHETTVTFLDVTVFRLKTWRGYEKPSDLFKAKNGVPESTACSRAFFLLPSFIRSFFEVLDFRGFASFRFACLSFSFFGFRRRRFRLPKVEGGAVETGVAIEDRGLSLLIPGLVSFSESSPDEVRVDREETDLIELTEGEDDTREVREEFEEADKLLVDLLA
jgi:hypothetical protein